MDSARDRPTDPLISTDRPTYRPRTKPMSRPTARATGRPNQISPRPTSRPTARPFDPCPTYGPTQRLAARPLTRLTSRRHTSLPAARRPTAPSSHRPAACRFLRRGLGRRPPHVGARGRRLSVPRPAADVSAPLRRAHRRGHVAPLGRPRHLTRGCAGRSANGAPHSSGRRRTSECS